MPLFAPPDAETVGHPPVPPRRDPPKLRPLFVRLPPDFLKNPPISSEPVRTTPEPGCEQLCKKYGLHLNELLMINDFEQERIS
jgi:hypothetical protein